MWAVFFSFVIFCFLHAEFFNELKVFDFLKSKFELINGNLYFKIFYVDFAQKGTRNFFFFWNCFYKIDR